MAVFFLCRQSDKVMNALQERELSGYMGGNQPGIHIEQHKKYKRLHRLRDENDGGCKGRWLWAWSG
ncbi:hypothetical protein PAT3040_00310 [Paenibacillus agaridevorans]|uniref:Uncharacterized protein n=1 Tax=Paenibacillus agaridevorans TaxID=171404 RepID=A0A2R5EIB4_9BACL|nr:hypothetical protein PAT3040_00310 [Paenibacillus agaridevorans]